MKQSNTAHRLQQIMEERNLRQIDILSASKPFCEKYGVKLGKNDLSQYVSGKVEPGQEKLTILGLALGVSEAWLMGYDVDRNRQSTTSYTTTNEKTPIQKDKRIDDPDIRRIERARKNMSEQDKQKMMNILKASFEEYFSDDYIDTDTDE